VSALTDLSDKKNGDHTGEKSTFGFCFLLAFSLPVFGQFHSLSLWVIHLNSLVLKVHLETLSSFHFFLMFSHHRTLLV
jgi:hypothetical protein